MLLNNNAIHEQYKIITSTLIESGIVSPLTISDSLGVIGIDGKEYPMPTFEQVMELFEINHELAAHKISQGFDMLELVPLAAPILHLAIHLENALLKHRGTGQIYRTRISAIEQLIPVRVNKEKLVWVWENLRQAFDSDELVYFPKNYSQNHQGMTKYEVINNKSICALPGWSVGLAESLPVMPMQGYGKTIGGRNQPEVGLSPREYLKILESPDYNGETGKTLEDFIIKFITQLETTNEVSNDINDNNALWCLGQYMKIPWAEVVPAGRWIRDLGRVRLDAHRTGNKKCTKNVGAATTVRLSGNNKLLG